MSPSSTTLLTCGIGLNDGGQFGYYDYYDYQVSLLEHRHTEAGDPKAAR
jgi:hypothetical protein